MEKRGQFFLVAAIIIVGVLAGLTAVVNNTRTGNTNAQFYDLGKEIGFETRKVIDYGVYNERDILPLTESFLEDYADYIAKEEVIFLIGDEASMRALHFTSTQNIVGLSIGANRPPMSVPIQSSTGRKAEVEIIDEKNVVVTINGIEYPFELSEGKNFYFVMIKTEDGERFVAKG
jgi:hypothetical protein